MSQQIPSKVLKSTISQTKKQIAKQQRFLDQWNPILITLKEKSAEEAVKHTIEYIQNRVDSIQNLLDTNKAELVRLTELLQNNSTNVPVVTT